MSTMFAADEAKRLLDAAIRGELPDERGRFGPFGGRYVPETLVPAFERLERACASTCTTRRSRQSFARSCVTGSAGRRR